jgi:hypothetical protein
VQVAETQSGGALVEVVALESHVVKADAIWALLWAVLAALSALQQACDRSFAGSHVLINCANRRASSFSKFSSAGSSSSSVWSLSSSGKSETIVTDS